MNPEEVKHFGFLSPRLESLLSDQNIEVIPPNCIQNPEFEMNCRFSNTTVKYLRQIHGPKLVFVKSVARELPIEERCEELTKRIRALLPTKSEYIVSLLGVNVEEHETNLVFEYADEGSLEEFIQERQSSIPLTQEEIKQCFLDIARAVLCFHEKEVIYSDISTKNCMVFTSVEGCAGAGKRIARVKLVNIELCRQLVGSEAEYRPLGENMVAVDRTAPEVWITHTLTKQSDIFALGITFAEIVSAIRAFSDIHGDDHEAKMLSLMSTQRPTLPADLNPNLRKLIQDCWHQNPAKRPTAAEIVSRLEVLNGKILYFTLIIFRDFRFLYVI